MIIAVCIETPRQPAVIRLLEASDAYAASLYPAESNHMVDLDALENPDVTFFVARRDDAIVGCCALINAGDGTGEIKRMFVDPDARGLAIGKQLLNALNVRAEELGLVALRLETGIYQPEALNLYRKNGFRDIEAFGDYSPDPLSVFMEKTVS